MSFLSKLTGRFQKQVNPAIFQFFNPSSMPKMGEKEYLRAYKGWVYAATNAIAERMADIELKLETKGVDGWKEVEEHEALDLVHKVNEFTSYYDLIYGTHVTDELLDVS